MINRKSLLHEELITKYKAYFESALAVGLLEKPEILPAVHEISMVIVDLIHKNKETVIQLIKENIKITQELFDTRYFGRLNSRKDAFDKIVDHILEKLTDKNTDISQKLQIHAIFTYRIYPELPNALKKQKSEYDERGRIETHKDCKLSTFLGITDHPVFVKKLEKNGPLHLPALGRFMPDQKSHYYKLCDGLHIPFVAGPSGHAVSLMNGALVYGLKNIEKLTQYALACFVFLAAGGNHSFNEVFFMANKIADIPFKINNYWVSFPLSFKESSLYQELCKQFPEFLVKKEEVISEISRPSL